MAVAVEQLGLQLCDSELEKFPTWLPACFAHPRASTRHACAKTRGTFGGCNKRGYVLNGSWSTHHMKTEGKAYMRGWSDQARHKHHFPRPRERSHLAAGWHRLARISLNSGPISQCNPVGLSSGLVRECRDDPTVRILHAPARNRDWMKPSPPNNKANEKILTST